MKRMVCVLLCITFIFCGAAAYGNDTRAKNIVEYIELCKTFLSAIQELTSKMEAARKSQKITDVMDLFKSFQSLWSKFQADFSALEKKHGKISSGNDVVDSPELEDIIDTVLEAIAIFQLAYTGEAE